MRRGLLKIRQLVGVDLLLRKLWAQLVFVAGVADERCVVADEEDGVVAELLKLAQLP